MGWWSERATGATDALSGGLDGLAGTLDSLTSSAVSGALSDVADNMSLITTAAGGPGWDRIGPVSWRNCYECKQCYWRTYFGGKI